MKYKMEIIKYLPSRSVVGVRDDPRKMNGLVGGRSVITAASVYLVTY